MSEQEEPSDVPFDAVIQAGLEDLSNNLSNSEGNDNAPALPPKSHFGGKDIPPHAISEDGQIRDAGSILTFNMPRREVSVHGQTETQDNQTNASESIKAFFGSVDARSEAAPSYEYNMRHNKRGLFMIFNHMSFLPRLEVGPRPGTHKDAENLEKTAHKLGFEPIRIFNDLDKDCIIEWVKQVAGGDHSEYDCFAMAVLTHGGKGDMLYAHDAKYHMDELTEPFMARECPTLAEKPKLFFIQACRGQKLDDGSIKQGGDTVDGGDGGDEVADKSEKEVMIIPNAANFLLAFSTVPGYYAWRNQDRGSWFIQALCKCLEQFGDELELMQIMTRVNRMVAYDFKSNCGHCKDKKQIPSIVTRLTHEVFFRKKTGSRTSSARRMKHRLPVLKPRKTLNDGTTETNGNSLYTNGSGKSENKLAGMKETPL